MSEWIPIKRLYNQCYIPELSGCKNKPYLVTYKTIKGRRYVAKVNIYNGIIQSKACNGEVIAYMPLPEPYKGE